MAYDMYEGLFMQLSEAVQEALAAGKSLVKDARVNVLLDNIERRRSWNNRLTGQGLEPQVEYRAQIDVVARAYAAMFSDERSKLKNGEDFVTLSDLRFTIGAKEILIWKS